MMRPVHLPNYTDPPLDEVVLGVQFAPIPGYTSVKAMKIWELFKSEFPKVAEHPILEAQFETFGGANVQIGAQFFFGAPPVGSRLWFISEDENHLVQFQLDRFIANWRKRPNTQPYPHFEGLAEAFVANFTRLAEHVYSNFNYQPDINQVEVTYINTIPVEQFSQIGEWFEFWNNGKFNIEILSSSFSEVINDHENKPFARLTHHIQSVFTPDGKDKAFKLSLSFKGKPRLGDINSAYEFLKLGRERIVLRFSEMTTSKAQTVWGKIG